MTSHSKEDEVFSSTIDFVIAFMSGMRYALENYGQAIDLDTLTKEMAATLIETRRLGGTLNIVMPFYKEQAINVLNIIRPLHETNKELS